MPDRDVLERRHHIAANEARQAGEILRQHWVALMWHRGGALLPFAKIFLGLEHLGPLQMPDLDRKPLDLACHYAEGRKIISVAVARDDLGGDRLWPQAQLLGHI